MTKHMCSCAARFLQVCRQALLQSGAVAHLMRAVHAAMQPLLAQQHTARPSNLPASSPLLGMGLAPEHFLQLLKLMQVLVNEANAAAGAGVPAAQAPAAGAAAGPVGAGSGTNAPSNMQHGHQQQQQGHQHQHQHQQQQQGHHQQQQANELLSSAEVKQLADGLALLERHGLAECGAVLAKVLFGLAQRNEAAQVGLLDHFMPALDLDALDAASCAGAAGGARGGSGSSGSDVQPPAVGVNLPAGGAGAPGNAAGGADAATGAAAEEDGSTGGTGAGAAADAAAVGSNDSAAGGGSEGGKEQLVQLQSLLRLTQALAADGGLFRRLVLERDVPGRLGRYLVSSFAVQAAAGAAGGAAAAAGDAGGAAAGAGGAGQEQRSVLRMRQEHAAPSAAQQQQQQGHPHGARTPSPSLLSPHTPRRPPRSPSPMAPLPFSHTPSAAAAAAAAAAAGTAAAGTAPAADATAAAGTAAAGANAASTAAPPPAPTQPQLAEPGSAQWQAAMKRPGISLALQLLGALATDHTPTASILASLPGLLPLLHQLEGVAGGSRVAPLAESLLEAVAVAGGDDVAEAVGQLRGATRAAMSALAARKREALLASLGLIQVGLRG